MIFGFLCATQFNRWNHLHPCAAYLTQQRWRDAVELGNSSWPRKGHFGAAESVIKAARRNARRVPCVSQWRKARFHPESLGMCYYSKYIMAKFLYFATTARHLDKSLTSSFFAIRSTSFHLWAQTFKSHYMTIIGIRRYLKAAVSSSIALLQIYQRRASA